MKKTFIVILISLFMTIPALAAWTVTAEQCNGQPFVWGNDVQMYCFQLRAESDAGASGDQTLSTLLETAYGSQVASKLMRSIAGTALYWVDYMASAAPDAPTTETVITILKEGDSAISSVGAEIFSKTVTTAATSQSWNGGDAQGTPPPITDVTVQMSTMANTKKAVIRLWFYGGRK